MKSDVQGAQRAFDIKTLITVIRYKFWFSASENFQKHLILMYIIFRQVKHWRNCSKFCINAERD